MHGTRGHILALMNRNEEALKDLDVAKVAYPNDVKLFTVLGDVCEKLGYKEQSAAYKARAADLAKEQAKKPAPQNWMNTGPQPNVAGPSVPAPESKAEPKADPKAEPKTEPKADAKAPPTPEPKADPKTPAKVDPKAPAPAKVDPKAPPKAGSKTP
jgi:hypothetical protein